VLLYVDDRSVVSFVSRLPAMDKEARSIGDEVPEGDGNSPTRQHRHHNDMSDDGSARTATMYTSSLRERDCSPHVSFCVANPSDNTAVCPAPVNTERANSGHISSTIDRSHCPACSKNYKEYRGLKRHAVIHHHMDYDHHHGVLVQF